jgi:predicted Zn-dependent protease
VSPAEFRRAMTPRNGFRFSRGGGRSFDSMPEAFATNIVFESRSATSLDDLIKKIDKGILVGRLWYTYPVNGLRAGDFTSTLTADSYLIEGGRITAPIKVNTLRVNDNVHNILTGIQGITRDTRPTVCWGGDQIMYAPVGVMVEKVHFDQIAEFMDSV